LRTCAKSEQLARKLESHVFIRGGDEHRLLEITEKSSTRVFKTTQSDSFGCVSDFTRTDLDGLGKHFFNSVNENVVAYLERWMWLNVIGGYETVFEGMLPPEPPLIVPSICISQPLLPKGNPTSREIEQQLRVYGFLRVSDDAYMHPLGMITITDAAPRNVRIVEGAEGKVPVLFDAIARLSTSEELVWMHEKFSAPIDDLTNLMIGETVGADGEFPMDLDL
jgi:hypothetical protein